MPSPEPASEPPEASLAAAGPATATGAEDDGSVATELVTITDLAAQGAGIARLADGCVVFVEGTIPGDLVRIRPTKRNRKLAFGELLEVVTPSPGRVPSRCDLWQCGGCPIKGTDLALQVELKVGRLAAALRRVGHIDSTGLLQPVLSMGGDGWGWRHRIRLHGAWRSEPGLPGPGRYLLGYHQRQSNTLVPLSTCPVAWPELERLGRAIAGGVAQLPREAGLKTLELAYSRRDGRGSAVITAEGSIAAFRQSLTWLEESALSGLEVRGSDGSFRWGNMELRYDHAAADAFDLRFEAGLFTQANVAANDLLVAQVLAAVAAKAGQLVLELHAGIGNFTLPISRAGAKVMAVELSRRSAIFLQRNAEGAGVAPEIHASRDEDALSLLGRAPDVVLLDPPRTGARVVAEAIASLGPKGPPKVVYVSCDPATFARDAATLASGGLYLERVQPIDLFPQTPHLECVGVFGRR